MKTHGRFAPDIKELSPEDLAWLAGLIEGEGWFGTIGRGKPRYARIQVGMTDEDVIRRVHQLVGVGSTCMVRPREGRKTLWQWTITGRQAKRLMEQLLPLMGERRSLRIIEILSDGAS